MKKGTNRTNAQHFTKIREAIIDAYGYFYQYHNRNQIKLVVKKGWHSEVESDGFL